MCSNRSTSHNQTRTGIRPGSQPLQECPPLSPHLYPQLLSLHAHVIHYCQDHNCPLMCDPPLHAQKTLTDHQNRLHETQPTQPGTLRLTTHPDRPTSLLHIPTADTVPDIVRPTMTTQTHTTYPHASQTHPDCCCPTVPTIPQRTLS